jgi:hypothetical protein
VATAQVHLERGELVESTRMSRECSGVPREAFPTNRELERGVEVPQLCGRASGKPEPMVVVLATERGNRSTEGRYTGGITMREQLHQTDEKHIGGR